MKLLFLSVLVCAALHSVAAEGVKFVFGGAGNDVLAGDNDDDNISGGPPVDDKLRRDPDEGIGDKKRQSDPPNIIFILADDLGYNDIGYNNPGVISPNLDQLAREGRVFTQNYVQPSCTPSRTAILTSIYPYRATMQHLVVSPTWCTPTDLTFLPQRLHELGYETAVVGKWHLGDCQHECMPMTRGFDHWYGLLHGWGDYYLHSFRGLYDFRDQEVVAWEANNTYTTELLGARAVTLVENVNNPLFLYLSFSAVHTPLQVPPEYLDMYPGVAPPRNTYLAMMTAMDEAIGDVVQTLKDSGKWDNTLIVFSSDNGGETGGAADNSPYRGGKASLWEGGTRVVGFVSGPLLQNPGQEHDGIFHAVDWAPTLLHIAGETPTAGPTTTVGGTVPDGSQCVFPFTYNGKTYSGCTAYNSDTFWCSTKANYDGSWGECVQTRPVRAVEGNAPADQRFCVFPFKYQSKWYTSCTTKNWHEPWCATTSDYDTDKLWGDCATSGTTVATNGNSPADKPYCVFPFKYQGHWIDSCVTTNWDTEWCGTTADYDTDTLWGNCVPRDLSLDAVDQYEMVINGGASARNEIVHNIDYEDYAVFGHAGIRVGDYKLIWGHEGYCDGWGTDLEKFWFIPEQCALAGIECPPPPPPGFHGAFTPEEVAAQRAIIAVKRFTLTDMDSGVTHLFNLALDPYEKNDLADDPAYADTITELKQQVIDKINMEYVAPPPSSNATMDNPETNPDNPTGMKAWGLDWCSGDDITMP